MRVPGKVEGSKARPGSGAGGKRCIAGAQHQDDERSTRSLSRCPQQGDTLATPPRDSSTWQDCVLAQACFPSCCLFPNEADGREGELINQLIFDPTRSKTTGRSRATSGGPAHPGTSPPFGFYRLTIISLFQNDAMMSSEI